MFKKIQKNSAAKSEKMNNIFEQFFRADCKNNY